MWEVLHEKHPPTQGLFSSVVLTPIEAVNSEPHPVISDQISGFTVHRGALQVRVLQVHLVGMPTHGGGFVHAIGMLQITFVTHWV